MCKPSTSTYCLPPTFKDFEDAAKPFLTIASDTTKEPNEKRKASEEIGTLAAIQYNADRHGLTFSASQAAHEEFRGPHVVDLTYKTSTGAIEIKEAKGGSSSYGERNSHLHGKKVKQCTVEYTETIIDLMKGSNYKGRHPEAACAAHTGAPDGKCGDCKSAERKRRRKSGSDMSIALSLDNIEKHAVRGNYDGDCLKKPEKIEAYKIVGGKPVPV
ncbi:MAG TPA: hypothetical protein VK892_18880 [Pyrinomonadaceae bacterium]|nr:hypothetical protein [Pyrinomonadaceae bacterium]